MQAYDVKRKRVVNVEREEKRRDICLFPSG